MISPFSYSVRWSKVTPYIIILLPFVFFLFRMPYQPVVSDAASYAGYAEHIVTGQGYSFDNSAFNNYREPGYPIFLALIYEIFGLSNYVAVYITQTLLLGVIGFLVYRIFVRAGEPLIGFISGIIVAVLPSYGLYTHTIGTELLFAFMIMTIFYLMIVIETDHESSYGRYMLLGFLCGYATLVRVQLLFFLPIMIVGYLIYRQKNLSHLLPRVALAFLVFAVVVGSWMLYVHKKSGVYSITSGRQELALYIRADRAQLSYGELTQYAFLWVKRSITSGEFDQFLYDHEYHKLVLDYVNKLTTPDSFAASDVIAKIKKQSIATILAHPGTYIYGNVIEAFKTIYIEHDYSDVLNRYVRFYMYMVIYGVFVLGCVGFWLARKHKELPMLWTFAVLAILFIGYNISTLSFFDSIPRYNTPYLFCYLIFGCAGIALYLKVRRHLASSLRHS